MYRKTSRDWRAIEDVCPRCEEAARRAISAVDREDGILVVDAPYGDGCIITPSHAFDELVRTAPDPGSSATVCPTHASSCHEDGLCRACGGPVVWRQGEDTSKPPRRFCELCGRGA